MEPITGESDSDDIWDSVPGGMHGRLTMEVISEGQKAPMGFIWPKPEKKKESLRGRRTRQKRR